MKLYVNGQDIRRLVLGDVESGAVDVIETETEGYLASIDTYLKDAAVRWENIEAIYAVVGPGSATALRSILSILQTVHFVQGTALYAVKKDPDEDDAITIKRAGEDGESVSVLVPEYLHSPRITISHKDALGRS
ncbi:hypothetical protein HON52_04710 [Candidatus Uhrbacteria bacterium]|jgi:hypothetical protein|nr:hypothetical protein [Candidatus Uhrbacteria bacterium]